VIPGNHDNKNKVSRQTLRKLVEAGNGRLLVNETVQLTINGTPFTITGLDDFIDGESDFANAVKDTGSEPHHLLLLHSPLQQEQVQKELQRINAKRSSNQQLRIRYIFAGHTHGGQVRWNDFVPVLPEGAGGYVNGWYNNKEPYLYVSKGFGTSAVPFRFGARPEITLFEYGV
jgi:predicted MPP superfamily phosphohydrolase